MVLCKCITNTTVPTKSQEEVTEREAPGSIFQVLIVVEMASIGQEAEEMIDLN